MLWQIRLGAILANPITPNGGDRDGSGRSHSVGVPPSSEEAGPCRGAARHGGGTSEVASVASGQRKRPRPRESETSTPAAKSRIEQWPGRLYSASSDGSHRADDVQHRRESSEHHTGPRGGGRKMELFAPQRAGQDQSNATTHTSDLCHRHASETAGGQRQPSERGQARVAGVAIGPARRRSVGLHDVEGDQAPGGPRTGSRGQAAVHSGLGGPARPLTAELSGHSLTLLLELSLQDSRASQIMQLMRKCFGLGAWLMIGARLRPARVERSPLMKEVQDLAFGQDE